jgi:restriction endonuclease S subunit
MENYEKVELGDLLNIRNGYSFRRKVVNNPDGNISIIQMRDLLNEHTEINDDLFKTSRKEIKGNHLLEKGDILFLAKGTNNKALVFDKEYEAIATLTFFILTIKAKFNGLLLPHYVAWYINQRSAQIYFEKSLVGTSQRNVNSSAIKHLLIPLAPLEKQMIIAELSILNIKQKKLLSLISKKKELLIQETMLNLLNQ